MGNCFIRPEIITQDYAMQIIQENKQIITGVKNAGNSIRWNNSKKSKRIENNKSRYEKHEPMSKLDKLDKILIILFIVGVTMAIITSCQPTDPLTGLNCPCKVITAKNTPRGHKVTYIDKDGKEQTVISKALFDQYQKTLNK